MNAKVLSIQSHVVSGYVGNKSAVLPLQILGFEVDFVNSVQFSNHTWYKSVKGQILNSDQLNDLYEGLCENSLNNYTHLLTGYIGDVSFLSKVCDILKDLKCKYPNLLYICDPVMGDDGKMYVTPELLPVYRKDVLPLADIIVPNQFEAELLSDIKIVDEASALQALDHFHSLNIKTVVLSSTSLGGDSLLLGYASQITSDGSKKRLRISIPKFPVQFVGTGDLFAALVLAHIHKTPNDLSLVFKKVIGTMQAVLKKTYDHGKTLVLPGQKLTPLHLELRLIQSVSEVMNPPLHASIDLI